MTKQIISMAEKEMQHLHAFTPEQAEELYSRQAPQPFYKLEQTTSRRGSRRSYALQNTRKTQTNSQTSLKVW